MVNVGNVKKELLMINKDKYVWVYVLQVQSIAKKKKGVFVNQVTIQLMDIVENVKKTKSLRMENVCALKTITW